MGNAKGEAPTRYHVPTGPIRAVIDRAVVRHAREPQSGKIGEQLTAEEQVSRLIWPDRTLSSSQRTLFAIRNERLWMHFDTADRVVISLEGSGAWHSDPELNKIWLSVDLKALDAAKPCSAVAA